MDGDFIQWSRAPLLYVLDMRTVGKDRVSGTIHPYGNWMHSVTDHLLDHLFAPERLNEIFSSLANRRAEKEQTLNSPARLTPVIRPLHAETHSGECGLK